MSMLLELQAALARPDYGIGHARYKQLQAMLGAAVRLKLGVGIKSAETERGTPPPQSALFKLFAEAMLEKALASQAKRDARGESNHWTDTDWQADLVRDLWLHAQKGDPLDIAIYAAFAWWHGWRVAALDTGNLERLGEYASESITLFEPCKTWHELKVGSSFMSDLLSGIKPFEVRRDDRDFGIGHGLWLREFDGERHTGRSGRFVITSALRGPRWGVMPGFVCLGIRPVLYIEPVNELGAFLDALPELDPMQAEGLSRKQRVPFGYPPPNRYRAALCKPGGVGCQHDAACSMCLNFKEDEH